MADAVWFRARRPRSENDLNAASLFHLVQTETSTTIWTPCGSRFASSVGEHQPKPLGHWPDSFTCRRCIVLAQAERRKA